MYFLFIEEDIVSNKQLYQNPILYSLAGTEFSEVFDSPDGSSSDPKWHDLISELVSNGRKPIFNIIADEVCVKAWSFLLPHLGFMPNMLSVKISLAAGVANTDDMLSVFSTNNKWIDQASFRGALGDFLGIHNTQLLPLSMVVGREVSTQKLMETFSDHKSVMKYFKGKK